ncbi:MAG: Uncharacterised protein [Cyanobium sp. ARS6]|nr:MAG: Uncharacterised protein [Cyanobium sp. ARS6]
MLSFASRSGEGAGTSLHGPQTCHQFLDRKGFDQVVIHTGIEGRHPISNIVVTGEHQDWCGDGAAADSLADIHTTEIGKIPVQNDQVRGWLSACPDQASGPIGGHIHLIPLDLQFHLQEFREACLVIHEQEPGLRSG